MVDSPTSDDYTNNLNDLEVEHRPSICQNLVSLEKIVEIVHLSISKYSVVLLGLRNHIHVDMPTAKGVV